MTFKLNQQTIANRRYSGAIGFSVSSGPIFPYPATQIGTVTTYQYPETHWTSYGQMASEGSASGLVAYTYWSGAQGYTCAASGFAPFSMLSTDNYVNDFYCPNGGSQTTSPVYACPDGGGSDGAGNCVLEYTAVQVVTNTTVGPRAFFASAYGSVSAAYSAAAEVCSQPIYGNWSSETGHYYTASSCATYTYGPSCPYGGTYNASSGMCVY